LADNFVMAPSPRETAEAVRQACIAAALAAYEEAGVLGLCAEGRWEAAISALQSLDLQSITEPAAGAV
jgi:hypothetical protein